MYEVNDDVQIQVMSRLPLTYLLKYRVISKSWRDIIDSSYFRQLHAQNQLSNDDNLDHPVLLKLIRSNKQKFQQLSILRVDTGKSYNNFPSYQDFLRNNVDVQFSRPVHGLICLYNKNHPIYPIALCNPSLGEIKILPPSPTPSLPIKVVGFGYDDVEKDFKVVLVAPGSSISLPIVEVYSRKRNTWRVLPGHPIRKSYYPMKQLQHVEPSSTAVVHWRGWAGEVYEGREKTILSFNMRSETFEMIKIPVQGHINQVVAKENSSFIMLIRQNEEMNIWEYKYEREWIKLGKIGDFFCQVVWPAVPWKNDGFILENYSRDNKLDLYDVISEQAFKFFIFSGDKDFVDMVEYRGSFISP